MRLHDYETGEAIREMTPAEVARYREMIADDYTHTGAVDGEAFGEPGRVVYAESLPSGGAR